ncbi:MAG: response regulator [Candidatus Roizmanbacteria bacterium]|nr:response regulator [Candidatus Roizmanbacteria bacterium]
MKNILIVDDDKIYRDLLKNKLESEGYSVSEAENGKRALEILKIIGKNTQLILLDLHMPEMDGQTFYYELKNSLHLQIPIIILTNQSVAGYSADLKDFVVKTDITLDELTKKIDTYFT